MDVLSGGSFEVSDFQRDVIERSHERPVLVDFWAPWCGPCKMLGPLLEKAWKRFSGQFALVKVNVDEHPDLSRQYRVQGIPACKLFIQGGIIDEFTGVIPERALTDFLERHLPNERKQAIADAKSLIAQGHLPDAISQLEALLAEDDDEEVRLLLAGAAVWENPASVDDWLAPFREGHPHHATAEGYKALATLLQRGADAQAWPEGKAREQVLQAADALQRRDMEEALPLLINSILSQKSYDNQLARKACIGLFTHLGAEHPITRQYRRRFDMSLY